MIFSCLETLFDFFVQRGCVIFVQRGYMICLCAVQRLVVGFGSGTDYRSYETYCLNSFVHVFDKKWYGSKDNVNI